MNYTEKMEEAIKSLWTDLMEFSRKTEFTIQYWGMSYAPWEGGLTRGVKVIAMYMNTELWEELMSLIDKNGLRVKHWFISARKDEVRILFWVTLKEV
jgi:hypothetical protein